MASLVGFVIPTNSSLSKIHDQFGETFKIDDEDKWLFNEFLTELVSFEIEEGMPYEANYDVFVEPVAPEVIEVSFGVSFSSLGFEVLS